MNYLKEFYAQEEHDYKKLLNINESDNENIGKIKKEIKNITAKLEEKSNELHNELEKLYSKNFVPIKQNNILKYLGRNGNYYFDIDTGTICDNFEEENSNIYNAYSKRDKIKVVVGYNYELASIIVNEYQYNINRDNTLLNIKLIKEKIIPFMEDKGVELDLKTNNIEEDTYVDYQVINNIKNHDFINTLFGVDYKGNKTLGQLYSRFCRNKSFEIIIKTAPIEILDLLLDLDIEETLPIHKILGVSQETYNTAIEKGIIKELVINRDIISDKNNENRIKKTEKEWLDFIEEIKVYEEDLQFYNISYQDYRYSYNKNISLLRVILSYYTNSRYYNFEEYYSLGKFANYVINETINQGYTSISNFINELGDYLNMCKQDNIKPTLYSSYLKQTHDITSRNHRIIVERDKEIIFASKYEDFKKYKTTNNYVVVAPKCTDDLKLEGDRLNHCVASYIKRVIDGECLIYFLRRKEEESLITFEVRNNRIVQVKGLHNRKPNDSEINALKEFAKDREMELYCG